MTSCTHHVFAWLCGYGATVVPHAPFRTRYGPLGDNVLEVEHRGKFAQITFDRGGYTSTIDAETQSLYDVVDITSGPERASWSVETAPYRCLFPADYWLCSTDDEMSLFMLVGPHGELMFFQSPKRMPPVAELVGEGQTVEGTETDGDMGWIELSYTHEGVRHRQRHRVLTRRPGNLALTVQAPEEYFDQARTTMEAVAHSVEYARPSTGAFGEDSQ